MKPAAPYTDAAYEVIRPCGSHTSALVAWLSLSTACAFVLQGRGTAQQTVPFENGTPIAPAGFEPHAIPAEPHRIRHRRSHADPGRARGPRTRESVEPGVPPRLAAMLVTEKEGRLRIIRNGVLDPKPMPGAPAVRVQGRSGLMDVVLHPQFATNRLVYFSYLKPVGSRATGRIDRRSRALRWIRHHRAERHLQLRSRRGWTVTARIRTRRQTVYDDPERRERQQLSGSEQLLGQDTSPQ